MATSEQLEILLGKVEERERKARKRAVIYTLVPIVFAAGLIWVTWNQVTTAQKELVNIEKERVAAKSEIKSLNNQFSKTVSTLSKVVSTSHKIEDFIEKKESFLRDLDEARFLINIRMLFDQIDSEISDLSSVVGEIPDLKRDRIWVTIVKSSKTKKDLETDVQRWISLYGKDQVAIYLSQNKYFALALKEDGSFTKAFRLTVELKEKGLAKDAYFASSTDWGKNFLE